MRHLLLAGPLLLAAPAVASVQTGAEKWNAGDWAGAIAQWTAPAARGDADALFNMGQAYRLGRGVGQSNATAIDYYRRAADRGHVGAMTNLGITLYQEGRKTEALNQLRQAAEKGDLRASYVLGVATFGGDGAPRNPALGYAYVVRARDGGLALAGAQAARMATLMTEADRARGNAAAAALATGKPVAVVLAELASPVATMTAEAEPQTTAADDEDSAEDNSREPAEPSKPKPADSATRNAPRPPKAEEAAEQAPARTDRKREEKSAEKNTGKSADKGHDKQAASAKSARSDDESEAGGWKVQLGAYASEGAARTAWATLVSQSAKLLKGRKPIYAPRGNLVRLQVGAHAERADAAELCAKLSAAGRPCFVTR